MCKLIDQELFPVLNRKKMAGITVYQKLESKIQNEDAGSRGNFYLDKFKVNIPYLIETEKFLSSIDENTKGVIIATNNVPVAEKVANYIEDYKRVLTLEKNKQEVNDFFSAYTDDIEFDFGEEEVDFSSVGNLYNFSLNIQNDSQKDAGNIYVRLIQKGGPSEDDAVIYTDLNTGLDIGDKIDAVLSSREGNSTYIHILPGQVNSPWVSDLILNHDYELICLPELNNDYYVKIFNSLLSSSGYMLENNFLPMDAVGMIRRKVGREFREEDINNSICHAIKKSIARGEKKNMLKRCDFTITGDKEKTAAQILEEMPGLEGPKKMIKEMIALCKAEANNERLKGLHKNMIFAGNPGSAKTTMAEITGHLLAENNISNGNFVIATRADLIGEYVGKTAVKTAKKFEEARGGVLLIDEAAFLMNTDSGGYVQECIKEIVRYTELYPDVLVIMACYDNEVTGLLNLDEGLSSRFSKVVHFEDYKDDVIEEITNYMYKNLGYSWDKEGGKSLIMAYIDKKRKEPNYANARDVRKVVEGSIVQNATRTLMVENAKYSPLITVEDIQAAIDELSSKLVKEKISFGFV